MIINCTFRQHHETFSYACEVFHQEIPPEVNELTFTGAHTNGHKNDDVTWLLITNSSVPHFPNKIGEVFKNLKRLNICHSNLKEVTKENLQQFPHLEELNLSFNQLEYLPGDLFEFNKKLREVSFTDNKIKFIDSELLDGLEKLELASFRRNAAIDCCYVKSDKDTLTLAQLKDEIKAKCRPHQEHFPMAVVEYHEPKIFFNPRQNFNDDLDKMLALDEFKDFSIKVDSTEFKVHKLIFVARSPTFAEFVRSNPSSNQWILPEISVETFKSVLNFVYKDEPPKDLRNIRNVFAAASDLKIEKLKQISAKILESDMKSESLDSLLENFNLGLKYECNELKLKAFEEIQKHFPGRIKEELLEQPENLKVLIDTKKMQDKFLEDNQSI